MGANCIPKLNILHDHKRWKVLDLGVKTQSPVSQSPSAVNRVVLSPAISLSPALSILALLCQSWAALAKAAFWESQAGSRHPPWFQLAGRCGGIRLRCLKRSTATKAQQQRSQTLKMEFLFWLRSYSFSCFISVGLLLWKRKISLLLP